jgi:peroxiredoxin
MPAAVYRLLAIGASIVALGLDEARAAAEDDWQQITALDAGPRSTGRNEGEARAAVLAHLDLQESALRKFLAHHPTDPHAFEARLRLARLLQIRGDVQGDAKSLAEAVRLLDALEKSATAGQRAEIDFARITFMMRTLRKPTSDQRERLLDKARKFQLDHPDDRRIAALLVEVATLFELQPKIMRDLLTDAQALATDPQLKAQIEDDLKRIELFGQPLRLEFTTTRGETFTIEQLRGSVVVLVFFAIWSGPSINALDAVREAAVKLPKDAIRIVGVSLDAKPEPLSALLKEKNISWPVGYDGKGWESPVIRTLGINSLPTVWLLDKEGRLRSLDGLANLAGQARQLLDPR